MKSICPFCRKTYIKADFKRVDCPNCKHKGLGGLLGKPGTTWLNETGKIQYQMVVDFSIESGACMPTASCIGSFWPIPICSGCTCLNHPIMPGERSLPFLDFQAEFAKLDFDRQCEAIGRLNALALKSGLFSWGDLSRTYRVCDFEGIMDAKRLTIEQMVAAGIPEADANAAWKKVYTPQRRKADADRQKIMRKLMAKGLSREDIKKMISIEIVKRIKPGDSKS
ncbi:hypothetical protein [Singulisphaera sp. PoT]|uniref:hypothetical protein n=1 Tax=Singulisphaera sp. PoT TaxID=3411797 RepID=UPI003BF4AEFE